MGLFCWGDNFRGDLGIGNEFVKESPQPVALPNVISLASAAASTCAVTSDGKLFCWGEAADGEPVIPRSSIRPAAIATRR